MDAQILLAILGLAIVASVCAKLPARWRLSRAKHPSLRGHPRIARLISKRVPYYEYDESEFFLSDGAPGTVAGKRREAFLKLAEELRGRVRESAAIARELEQGISDAQFTKSYRVPFQYRSLVNRHLPAGLLVIESSGSRLKDVDGNWYRDVAGSYGVNLLG